MADRLIVISDLHISAQHLDDFDDEIESRFVEFLTELASGRGSVELVINGDFLDFVQAPPYEGDHLEATSAAEGQPLCFTERQSTEKLEAVYRAHPRVFKTLEGFLAARSSNVLTLLPGNHDADLFWPAIQLSLARRIASTTPERFRIHLDRVYQPDGFPGLWIEHGHQFDRINSFFLGPYECWSQKNPPLLKDVSGTLRLFECLGTRFLLQFLNRLDRDYPYVDNVKPFSVFLRLFAASAFISGYAPLRVALVMWRLLWFLSRTGMTRPSDLLTAERGPVDVNTAMMLRLQAVNERSKELQKRVHKAGFMPSLPLSLVLEDPKQTEQLMVFLSDHVELMDGVERDEEGLLGLSGDEGTLSLARGYRINESKELMAGAADVLKKDSSVKMVIMGHTHEPLDRPGGLAYVNTGCWTRYYERTGSDKLRPWSLLKAAAGNQFPYALNFAEVLPDAVDRAEFKSYAGK